MRPERSGQPVFMTRKTEVRAVEISQALPAGLSSLPSWKSDQTPLIVGVFENAHLEKKPACGDGSPVGE